MSRIQFRESSLFKCAWRQIEVVIIQATVSYGCSAMEESLDVSLSYSVTIPFYLLAFFPAVARIKHTSYVVPD